MGRFKVRQIMTCGRILGFPARNLEMPGEHAISYAPYIIAIPTALYWLHAVILIFGAFKTMKWHTFDAKTRHCKASTTDFSKRRKIVRSIVHRRSSFRREDLPVIPSPLRMVDAVDPVLRLDHYAAVLVHELGTASRSPIVALYLAWLDRYRPVLANAAV